MIILLDHLKWKPNFFNPKKLAIQAIGVHQWIVLSERWRDQNLLYHTLIKTKPQPCCLCHQNWVWLLESGTSRKGRVSGVPVNGKFKWHAQAEQTTAEPDWIRRNKENKKEVSLLPQHEQRTTKTVISLLKFQVYALKMKIAITFTRTRAVGPNSGMLRDWSGGSCAHTTFNDGEEHFKVE